MSRKFKSNSLRVTRRSFSAALGAGLVAGVAPFNIVRAEGGPLKVGVLLPRSGFEAGIGEDCQRAVDIAPAIFKSMGLPDLTIINGDTESNVDTARARAEKLIGEGAQALVGSFDSGQSSAIAQVAEQKGIPYVINIAAAPQITEQGYKFVFRNFPTAPMILRDAFTDQKTVFAERRGGSEVSRLHACQRHFRHSDEQRHRRGHAEVQHAVHDRRRDRLRSNGARSFRRGGEGKSDQSGRHCSSSAA